MRPIKQNCDRLSSITNVILGNNSMPLMFQLGTPENGLPIGYVLQARQMV